MPQLPLLSHWARESHVEAGAAALGTAALAAEAESATPAIETADDLAPLIDELVRFTEEAGRDEVLDVHFGVPGGGMPGTDAFDPAHHLDQIAALEGIGVNAVGTGAPGDGVAAALQGIEAYGEAVIKG